MLGNEEDDDEEGAGARLLINGCVFAGFAWGEQVASQWSGQMNAEIRWQMACSLRRINPFKGHIQQKLNWVRDGILNRLEGFYPIHSIKRKFRSQKYALTYFKDPILCLGVLHIYI